MALSRRKSRPQERRASSEYFFLRRGGGEARVGGGGGADFKFVGKFGGKVAGLGPVAAHPVASGIGGTEGVMIVGSGGLVKIKEFLAERAFLAGGAAALLVFEGDLETLGEGLDGLDKAEALGLADESDEVPGFAAAKALVDAHVGVDVERRGFFAVEGAEAFVAWAGLFKGDDPANDIDDADAGAQIADTGGFKEGHGQARGARGLSGKIVLKAKRESGTARGGLLARAMLCQPTHRSAKQSWVNQ